MSDLISRQAAAEVIYKALKTSAPDYHIDPFHDSMSLAVAMAKAIPSAQPEQRWILCSDRLPDVRHNVLITDGNHTAEGQLQDNGAWMQYRWTCLRKHNEIIAWQPLPEPYKADMNNL